MQAAATIQHSQEIGAPLIKRFEGCKLKAYEDAANVWTIGYGNTQYENGISVRPGDRITQQRADSLFLIIYFRFESGVINRVQRRILPQQIAALTSFCYNVGFGNFDKSTLLKKVKANPDDPTIRDEFMKWNKAGGKVLKGLTKRRKEEADVYFSK